MSSIVSQPPHPRRSTGLRIGTIRERLLVAFVLLVFLPAIIISSALVVLGFQSGQQQVINQLESVATLKEAQIDAWLESLQSHLDTALYPHQVPHLLNPLLTADPQSAAYEAADAELRIQLDQLVERTRLFEEVFILDRQGRVLISTRRQQEGEVHTFQDYFWQGLHAGYVQSLSSSTAQGRSPVIVACPIHDLEGTTRGVIVGKASPERLNAIMIQWAGLGLTGETYLVGSNYLLLTATRSQSQDNHVFRLRTAAVDTVLHDKGNLAGLYANYRDIAVVGVYRWLPRLEMVLVAEQEQAEAFQVTTTMLAVGLAVAGGAVLLALGFGVLVVQGIATPLANLSETAARIAAGDLAITAPVEREDEIGTLAQAFNQMTTCLHSLIDNLEQRVTELKQTQEELRWAKEAAEAASYAKSAFLANMSHELRTPLNAILGYAEMLQEEAADEENQALSEDLSRINVAAHHLLDLISDILDLSKIEAGRIELCPEEIAVTEVVDTSVLTVQSLVNQNSNTLHVEYRGELGIICTDIVRLRQVLVNVLSNAAKFTHQGTICLTVERVADGATSYLPPATSNTPRDNEVGTFDLTQGWVVFRISDTGIGMTQEQVGRIFQPFTQADVSTTRKYGGTGLGLAITWRFCQLMGGTISVESEVNQGSIFTILLPAHLADPNEQNIKARSRGDTLL